jgi:hypothetical protein
VGKTYIVRLRCINDLVLLLHRLENALFDVVVQNDWKKRPMVDLHVAVSWQSSPSCIGNLDKAES